MVADDGGMHDSQSAWMAADDILVVLPFVEVLLYHRSYKISGLQAVLSPTRTPGPFSFEVTRAGHAYLRLGHEECAYRPERKIEYVRAHLSLYCKPADGGPIRQVPADLYAP